MKYSIMNKWGEEMTSEYNIDNNDSDEYNQVELVEDSRQSQFEKVVNWIESQIIEGKYALGESLPSQRSMCESLGVSRTILRESLRAIESKGLISIFPGKGSYVRKPSYKIPIDHLEKLVDVGEVTFDDLLQARHLLEPSIAHIAALNATSEIIEILENDLEMMKKGANNGEKFIIADQNFHIHLGMATNNPVLIILNQLLVKNLVLLRTTVYEASGAPYKAIERHEEILLAIKSKHAANAFKAMENHLNDTYEIQRALLMQRVLDYRIK